MKIIVHLMGGLGNQMFQYALGRNLTLQRPEVSLSLYFEDPYKLASREYSLPQFATNQTMATRKDLRSIGPERGLERRVKKFLKIPIEQKVMREKKNFEFDPTILSISSDRYLIGFWQSYKYFEAIRKELLVEFQPVDKGDSFIKASQLIKGNSASLGLHIRRSDYINPSSGFSPLSLRYYRDSLAEMSRLVPSQSVYIFTDDSDWARSVFIPSIEFPGSVHIVSSESLKDHEELILMSLCRRLIIANSSFSWWAGWLNQWPEKKILAPKCWNGTDESLKIDDLIPHDWILI